MATFVLYICSGIAFPSEEQGGGFLDVIVVTARPQKWKRKPKFIAGHFGLLASWLRGLRLVVMN